MTEHKQYVTDQYKLAYLDYKTARNEEEQWDARRRMSRLMRLAVEMYGFEFADQLQLCQATSGAERNETP